MDKPRSVAQHMAQHTWRPSALSRKVRWLAACAGVAGCLAVLLLFAQSATTVEIHHSLDVPAADRVAPGDPAPATADRAAETPRLPVPARDADKTPFVSTPRSAASTGESKPVASSTSLPVTAAASATLPGPVVVATPGSSPVAIPLARDEAAASRSLADMIQAVEPSVVRVNVTTRRGGGFGSGFLADDDGHVVTNFHVIAEAASAEVVFHDGTRTAVAGSVKLVPGKDLAILRINAPLERLKPATLAAESPRKGESVVAFGAPLGFSFTASTGIVSAIRAGRDLNEELRQLLNHDFGHDADMTWIQITAPISPGNSGGPIMDLQGRVVALGTLGFDQLRGQNLNFCVSARDIAQALAERESKVSRLTPVAAEDTAPDRGGPTIRPAPGPPRPYPPGGRRRPRPGR